MEIYKIVLTGGPCAGKTTIIDFVENTLKDEGYYVITVPETATNCITMGIMPNQDKEHTLRFQDYILRLQTTKEQIAEEYADNLKKKKCELIGDKKGIIILYDRAIMDNRAYLSIDDYNNLLAKYGYKEIRLIDKYDLVINLISTATTKQDSYALNGIRYESVDEAKMRDELTSNAWLLHHNLRVIKPTDKLEEKAALVLKYIHDLLIDKQKQELVRLPLDINKSDLSLYNDNNSKRISITNIFLRGTTNFKYVISKRRYNGYTSFIKRKVRESNNGFTFEENGQISEDAALEKICSCGIRNISHENVLAIINKGNYYRVIEDSNGLFLLEVDRQDIKEIPHNLVLKKEATNSIK